MTTGDVALNPDYCMECGWYRSDTNLPHSGCSDMVIDGALASRIVDADLAGSRQARDLLIGSSDPAVAEQWLRMLSETGDARQFERALAALGRCGRDDDVPLLDAIRRWDLAAIPVSVPTTRQDPLEADSRLVEAAKKWLTMSSAGREVLWGDYGSLDRGTQEGLVIAWVRLGDPRADQAVLDRLGEWPIWDRPTYPQALIRVMGEAGAVEALVEVMCRLVAADAEGMRGFSSDVASRLRELRSLVSDDDWSGDVEPRILAARADAAQNIPVALGTSLPPARSRIGLPLVSRRRIVLAEPAAGSDWDAWDVAPTPRLGGQPRWLAEPTWPLTPSGAPYSFWGQLPVEGAPEHRLFVFRDDAGSDLGVAPPFVAFMQPGPAPRVPYVPLERGPRRYGWIRADPDPADLVLERLVPRMPLRYDVTLVEELEPDWQRIDDEWEYAYEPGDLWKIGGAPRAIDFNGSRPPGDWRLLAQFEGDMSHIALFGRPDGTVWAEWG